MIVDPATKPIPIVAIVSIVSVVAVTPVTSNKHALNEITVFGFEPRKLG
jgi:hypothetical protein